MNVTNNKLSSLIDVVYKYSDKLLSLLYYTAITTLCLQDNEANTLFLITIFIILLILKVGLSGLFFKHNNSANVIFL